MLVSCDLRQPQWAVAAVMVFALCFLWFLQTSSSKYPLYSSSQLRQSASTDGNSGQIELEGIKMGQPFEVSADESTADTTLEQLGQALMDRYATLNVDTNHQECSINLTRYESSGVLANPSRRLHTNQRITIALNLYNSEAIIPSLSLALLGLVHHLQPAHQVYVSIFENDSTDKTTELLGNLAAALVGANVSGLTFRSSILHRPATVDRIRSLANLRNEAVLPLLPYAADGILLFINDVITCTSDLLELLHQLRLQKAHGVMSTDWDNAAGRPRFRDIWVARGINGELPYMMSEPAGFTEYAPTGNWARDLWSTQDPAIHQRWLDGRPFPVYSGWNGAIALDARLFTEYHIRFRASTQAGWFGGGTSGAMGQWGEMMSAKGYLESDCSASECKLFARDVWNLVGNGTRFVLAPQSRTTYSLHDWEVMEGNCPPTRRTGAEEAREELIDWSNITIPTEVVCVPSLKDDGSVIDPWSEQNTRLHFNPKMDGWPRDQ